MDKKLKAIIGKYTLKETAGFEKKSTKETNVEEDLRNNYETGELVPYQSVIAEGKIVGNSKIKLKEKDEKYPGISEEYFKNQISEYLDNTIDYAKDHDEIEIKNEESAKDLLRKIIWDEITNLQDEIYESFLEKLEDEEDGEEETEDGDEE